MIADTSDIHELSVAQRAHADDLTSVAANLLASRVAADAFGTVGAGFLAALNDALLQEARHATELAERCAAARHVAGSAAKAYDSAEHHVGQSISRIGT
ncbi:hypothetical protein H7J06_08165 [Mycobacterium hodleri]|uniref:hypothetical protein n=1 Tax=Mycolicibacterium hodleri TaxID=49897 RepID=UPI0021F2F797|nr:hypothetical protein [Mycolicibacterium hodleri]MCV7132962.1 hypothetical protein [Mycolicibacterium hodleri]